MERTVHYGVCNHLPLVQVSTARALPPSFFFSKLRFVIVLPLRLAYPSGSILACISLLHAAAHLALRSLIA